MITRLQSIELSLGSRCRTFQVCMDTEKYLLSIKDDIHPQKDDGFTSTKYSEVVEKMMQHIGEAVVVGFSLIRVQNFSSRST